MKTTTIATYKGILLLTSCSPGVVDESLSLLEEGNVVSKMLEFEPFSSTTTSVGVNPLFESVILNETDDDETFCTQEIEYNTHKQLFQRLHFKFEPFCESGSLDKLLKQ